VKLEHGDNYQYYKISMTLLYHYITINFNGGIRNKQKFLKYTYYLIIICCILV